MSELPLRDDDRWGPPLQIVPTLLDRQGPEPRRGLHLWAPERVALDERRSLPVHLGAVGDVGELARLSFVQRAIVVAIHVASGRAHAVRVGRGVLGAMDERLAPAPGFEGGLGPTTSALAAEVARCNLWDSTGQSPPWPAGAYRLTAIAADRASAPSMVRVERSMTTVDPAVLDASSAADGVWPAPDPAGGLPRYDALEGALPPPDEAGIVIGIDRVVKAGHTGPCVLQGALRSRAPEAGRPPRSIVSVTLVITGTETPGPVLVPLRVPTFDRGVSHGGTQTAHFALDLLRVAPLQASPQTYFVYAFTADGMAGPHPVAVVAG
jgi:hypothetical protein